MGLGFFEGLVKSVSMTVVSEIGDKTFFVAALMAMRHPRRWVLTGALGAISLMTILSAVFGWAAPNLIPRTWTHHATTVLFLAFGLRSLWEGITSEGGESEELKEVEEQLKSEDDSAAKKARLSSWSRLFNPVLVETFSLVFFGEWGDKSQLATIGLAAEENVYGVVAGGLIGQVMCTVLAVLGGKHLAAQISEKLIGILGGLLFVVFGILSFFTSSEAHA